MYQLELDCKTVHSAIKTDVQILGIFSKYVPLCNVKELPDLLLGGISKNTEYVRKKFNFYIDYFKGNMSAIVDYLINQDGNYWVQSDSFKEIKTHLVATEVKDNKLILTFNKKVSKKIEKQLKSLRYQKEFIVS